MLEGRCILQMKYAIGIAIGEVNIVSGIVNQYGDLIQQELINTDQTDAEKSFDSVVKCVEKLLVHSSIPFEQISGIGISVPGKVDEKGVVDCHVILSWNEFPLAQRMSEAFKLERIKVDTDVAMASYVERDNQKTSTMTIEASLIGSGLSVLKE